MKRVVVGAVVALFLLLGGITLRVGDVKKAWAYSGTLSIWAQKANDFIATNFAGTTTGRDAAYTFVGTNGLVQFGPDAGSVGVGTIPYGVTVLRPTYTEYGIYGRPFVWGTRTGTQGFKADSTGINVTGNGIFSGSGSFPSGVNVGNGGTVTQIKLGTFTLPSATILAATTVDQTVTVSGYLFADGWRISAGPTTDMSDGIVYSNCRVSADNTFKVRRANKCGLDVSEPSRTFSFVAFR